MASKRELCDECLEVLTSNLTSDMIKILETLRTNKAYTMNLSIDKVKIMPQIKNMTDYKFQTAISTLEICNLVGRNSIKRPNKFFITEDGKCALKIFKKNTTELLSEK